MPQMNAVHPVVALAAASQRIAISSKRPTPFSSTSAASLTCVKRAAACGDLSTSGWHTRAARRKAAFTSSLGGWEHGK